MTRNITYVKCNEMLLRARIGTRAYYRLLREGVIPNPANGKRYTENEAAQIIKIIETWRINRASGSDDANAGQSVSDNRATALRALIRAAKRDVAAMATLRRLICHFDNHPSPQSFEMLAIIAQEAAE
jgi:hypothetical protein